jgi:hypothetical protein
VVKEYRTVYKAYKERGTVYKAYKERGTIGIGK